MKKVSIERIIRDVEKVRDFPPEDSYMLSYREFVAYFAGLESIAAHNFIIGAHFMYGWMRRQLELKRPTKERLSDAVAILNEVKKHGRLVGEEELLFLESLINNSLVGVSKLLHFINPHIYAIWDSRVYEYINGSAAYSYRLNNPENYLAYLENCREITQNERFKQIHAIMNEKIGYEVTPYRALELIMFENSS